MALEDLNEEVTPEGKEPTSADLQVENPTPQLSDIEAEAQEMGWRPKSEWKGDEDDFVSAKEFVRRKSFYERISKQSKELKELKATLEGLKEHHKNIETYTRKQVLEELKGAKKQALLDGDPDKVIEVDEAIMQFKLEQDKAEAEEKAAKAKKEAAGLHPDFIRWTERNSWYDTSISMRNYADGVGKEYKEENPDASPEKVLAYVEREVKARFKDKFENPKRKAAATVESSTPGGGAGTKDKPKYDPSEEERKTAKKFVRQGLYASEDEFYAELAKISKQ